MRPVENISTRKVTTVSFPKPPFLLACAPPCFFFKSGSEVIARRCVISRVTRCMLFAATSVALLAVLVSSVLSYFPVPS